ncbi:hypothetical protein COOONC_27388 [Cooperia oncophora]
MECITNGHRRGSGTRARLADSSARGCGLSFACDADVDVDYPFVAECQCLDYVELQRIDVLRIPKSSIPLDIDPFYMFTPSKNYKEDDEDSGFRSRVNSGLFN